MDNLRGKKSRNVLTVLKLLFFLASKPRKIILIKHFLSEDGGYILCTKREKLKHFFCFEKEDGSEMVPSGCQKMPKWRRNKRSGLEWKIDSNKL